MNYEPEPGRAPYVPPIQPRFDSAPPGPPLSPPGPYPKPDAPKPGRWRRWVTVGVVGLAGLVIGTAANSSQSSTTPATRTVTVTQSARPAVERGKAVATSTVVVTETQKPKKVFGDGSWLVGRDVPAGKYTTVEEISGTCYWERHNVKNDGIIDNDIPAGGHPTVILKAGEEFRSRDCGDWRAA